VSIVSTLKEVLGREAERTQLRNVTVCILLVILVVAIAFGLIELKPVVESTAVGSPSPMMATGAVP
jgi:hypothetical protein